MKVVRQSKLSPDQIAIRRRYVGATFVTCVVVSLVIGTIHVIDLGANRMQEMRDKAGIDLAKEAEHIRGAGEDLFRADDHEKRRNQVSTYTVEEVAGLLSLNEWKELETMQLVEAGPFIMGTDSLKTDEQNRPAHTPTLKAYYIDKYPVTNAQYARFVAETNRRPPLHWEHGKVPSGFEKHPVTMITWFDARDYAKWAKKRIPTEAEWEKAARGTDGRRWPWGNEMIPSRLNTYYNKGNTTEVGSYPEGASPYGVLDMAGNVSEWVANDFLPYQMSSAPEVLFTAKVPQLPLAAAERSMRMVEFIETEERYKVMRGGSWKSDPFSTATYHRNFSWPNFTSDFYGFRTAKDAL